MKNYFKEAVNAAGSIGLPQGVHENVIISHIETGYAKNKQGLEKKKQFYILFRKLDKFGRDLGTHEMSLFRVDANKSYALDNLAGILKHVYSVLELFIEEKKLDTMFDPFKDVLTTEGENSVDIEDEFEIDTIRGGRLEHSSSLLDLEKKIINEAVRILETVKEKREDNKFRLKLIETKGKSNNVFIDVPRYGEFIELMSVTKKESKLYI